VKSVLNQWGGVHCESDTVSLLYTLPRLRELP
jgi:hypothetical protein